MANKLHHRIGVDYLELRELLELLEAYSAFRFWKFQVQLET